VWSSFSGHDYEHRRQWIVDKLVSLFSVFSIDLCAVVLRVDQDSESEVIDRWTGVFSARTRLPINADSRGF